MWFYIRVDAGLQEPFHVLAFEGWVQFIERNGEFYQGRCSRNSHCGVWGFPHYLGSAELRCCLRFQWLEYHGHLFHEERSGIWAVHWYPCLNLVALDALLKAHVSVTLAYGAEQHALGAFLRSELETPIFMMHAHSPALENHIGILGNLHR